MATLFHPAEETFVVSGDRESWLKRSEEALRANSDFRGVESSPALYRLIAQYRRPPVWGDLTVTLTPEGAGSTRISAKATTMPNLFTLLFSPEHHILDDFAHSLR